MKPLHVLVEEEQHEWVWQKAKEERTSMGEVVREILAREMENEKEAEEI